MDSVKKPIDLIKIVDLAKKVVVSVETKWLTIFKKVIVLVWFIAVIL